jgi:S-adenosylmethionine synthetase
MTNHIRRFTSEYVSDGHPDKICDQISDGILDAALAQDPYSRVAIETGVKGNSVYVFGEMTTNAVIPISQVIRDTLIGIGYGNPIWGFDPWKINIIQNITEQSHEIGGAVDGDSVGAGDQGLVFGYAVQETPEMMPLPIMMARGLIHVHRAARHSPFTDMRGMGPDAKAQVTIAYDVDTGKPVHLDTVVFSTVHRPDVDVTTYRAELMDYMLGHFNDLDLPDRFYDRNTKVLINPAGPWHIGGPIADAGLTGRKIIVDTYGGAARHGGGCFSGKDPTKVDRSAAYAARHLAKLLCDRLGRHRTEVQISYAIGVVEPVSVHVYGLNEGQINEILQEYNIDLTPSGIIDRFDLRRPIYLDTAQRGHFGRNHLPWEKV